MHGRRYWAYYVVGRVHVNYWTHDKILNNIRICSDFRDIRNGDVMVIYPCDMLYYDGELIPDTLHYNKIMAAVLRGEAHAVEVMGLD